MLDQTNPLNAANPSQSAVVKASAGVGKTYLLVTRLIRLLLNGVKPDAILAITFTRKAAAEMQTRLAERLFEFVECDNDQLKEKLLAIGIKSDRQTENNARHLYERIMKVENSVRTTTFHAFCQDILRRFPMEADVPPAFDLVENTASFYSDAWDALYDEATLAPDEELGTQLENLFDQCGGLSNTQDALQEFLNYRSDWWAYTQGESNPYQFACNQLESDLRIDRNTNPVSEFFARFEYDALREFHQLLQKHPTKSNLEAQQKCQTILEGLSSQDDQYAILLDIFFTKAGSARKREGSETLNKKMTPAGASRFVELHHQFVHSLENLKDQVNKHKTYDLCASWYFAGQRLVEHFQRIKLEQRSLDFTDLEWKAYELLHNSNNANWVQYKLDQRIEHLLVDEFQDTNPTQWNLLLPLLQELASQEDGRSVFIVGDEKQSIYAFRRAEPQLLEQSAKWVEQHMQANRYPMDKSRRSAPAIMDAVNLTFSDNSNNNLSDFHPHSTFNDTLWGKVNVLPLIEPDETIELDGQSTFRNPLVSPRVIERDTRHYREGLAIAENIKNLVNQQTIVGEGGNARRIEYRDFMLLLRTRGHSDDYELALREHGIPYSAATQAKLLDALEIQDLIYLLDVLNAPLNNLAVATVLRSPIFACSDADLLQIAGTSEENSWYTKLLFLVEQGLASERLTAAYERIEQWRTLAKFLPIHDLLDHIYFEGNLIERYLKSCPEHMKKQVKANLHTFINMALEIDSGRYPSIGRFLSSLEEMRENGEELGQDNAEIANSVRIMTIHGAKGLEAPVVFILDATSTKNSSKPYRALVNWPVERDRPKHFLLLSKKDNQDTLTKLLLQMEQARYEQEDNNLLYVALTRARQHLYVSGCRPKRSPDKLGWYGQIAQALQASGAIESNQMPNAAITELREQCTDLHIEPELGMPFHKPQKRQDLAPSQQLDDTEYQGELGRTRGNSIHRMLELLTDKEDLTKQQILIKTGSELGLPGDDNLLQECYDEALQVTTHPNFTELYDANSFTEAYNELSIQFKHGSHWRNGIIDRLIVGKEHIIILDYKTHRIGTQEIARKVDEYRSQLQMYHQGISRLWPDKRIKLALLFTHPVELAWIE